jgi:hypothetical protein
MPCPSQREGALQFDFDPRDRPDSFGKVCQKPVRDPDRADRVGAGRANSDAEKV